jgi:hypothetical protein
MGELGLQGLLADAKAMRGLIGRRVNYMGKAYEITDLLLEDDLLILSAEEGMDVQDDSYGRANRLVAKQQCLCFRNADGSASHIWEEIAFLDGPLER